MNNQDLGLDEGIDCRDPTELCAYGFISSGARLALRGYSQPITSDARLGGGHSIPGLWAERARTVGGSECLDTSTQMQRQ
jgi:hypothetical protein